MRIKQLVYFVEIIRCQSISKAAQNLYVSQPSLSQMMLSLEEELGFPLLIRTNHGTEPTVIGKRVYNDAVKLIEESARMKDEWQKEFQLSKTLFGTVHVVTNPSAYPMVSQKSLPAIKNTYPGIKCIVMEARRYEILQYIAQGKADLGVSNVVCSEREEFLQRAQEMGIEVLPLVEDAFRIAMSSKNPLTKKENLTTDDLKNVLLSLYSGQDGVGAPYYKEFFNQDEIIYVSSIEKMMKLVEGNVAVAVFPVQLMSYCHYADLQDKVNFLKVENASLPTTHYMAYRKNVPLSPEVERVKDVIRLVYGELEPIE